MKKDDLTVGQSFRVTNPDYNVLSELWEVVAIEEPTLTFSVTTYWVRDIAYVPISSTETVVGTVYEENERGLFISFKDPYNSRQSRIVLKGESATYLLNYP